LFAKLTLLVKFVKLFNLREMEGKINNGSNSQLIKRVQAGNNHVYLRGNGKNTVFYKDSERIEFLKRCNSAAKRHNCKILAFVLMDNHLHLQVESKKLVSFVKSILIGYVQWYNKQNGLSDKLFKTPFSSACKYTDESVVESIMYILCNPVKAGMCSHPGEYLWSSYDAYFNSRSPILKYIDIDTELIRTIFKTKKEFESAVLNYSSDIDRIRKRGKGYWPRELHNDIINHLSKILKGRNIFQLNRDEISNLILRLRKETGASFRQIASITHESYEEVRRIIVGKKGVGI